LNTDSFSDMAKYLYTKRRHGLFNKKGGQLKREGKLLIGDRLLRL
jgi:hypothetical protein